MNLLIIFCQQKISFLQDNIQTLKFKHPLRTFHSSKLNYQFPKFHSNKQELLPQEQMPQAMRQLIKKLHKLYKL